VIAKKLKQQIKLRCNSLKLVMSRFLYLIQKLKDAWKTMSERDDDVTQLKPYIITRPEQEQAPFG